jgi:hypothetical protein
LVKWGIIVLKSKPNRFRGSGIFTPFTAPCVIFLAVNAQVDEEGFLRACEMGQPEEVARTIKEGADPSAGDKDGKRAANHAAERNSAIRDSDVFRNLDATS